MTLYTPTSPPHSPHGPRSLQHMGLLMDSIWGHGDCFLSTKSPASHMVHIIRQWRNRHSSPEMYAHGGLGLFQLLPICTYTHNHVHSIHEYTHAYIYTHTHILRHSHAYGKNQTSEFKGKCTPIRKPRIWLPRTMYSLSSHKLAYTPSSAGMVVQKSSSSLLRQL